MPSKKLQIHRRTLGTRPSSKDIKKWLGNSPKSILIDIANICNLWCIDHCALPQIQLAREKAQKRGKKFPSPFIDADLLLQAFDEIAKNWSDSPPTLQVTADGEPFLHPDCLKLICYPAQLGLPVGTTTNGILLSNKAVKQMCQAGVDLINISLDAPDKKTYAQVRPTRSGKNMFPQVTRNIREGVQIRNKLKSKTRFMITMILRPSTRNKQKEFIQTAQDLGVDVVSFRPINTNAGLTFAEGLSNAKITRNKDGTITTINGQRRWPCHFPFTRINLCIAKKGSLRVTYCAHAWDRTASDLGLYPQDGSLADMWNSKKLKKARQAHLDRHFENLPMCAQCPDWFRITRTGANQQTFADIAKGKK